MLPFTRFPDVDPALGPEMRSTGEVMGIDSSFGKAFFKLRRIGAARSCRIGVVMHEVIGKEPAIQRPEPPQQPDRRQQPKERSRRRGKQGV